LKLRQYWSFDRDFFQKIQDFLDFHVLRLCQNELVSVCTFFDHRAIYVYFYKIISFVKVNIGGSVFEKIYKLVWRLVLPTLPDDAHTRGLGHAVEYHPAPASKGQLISKCLSTKIATKIL
jgi:hypothetical protein